MFTNELLYDLLEVYNHVYHNNHHNLYVKLNSMKSFDQRYSINSVMICLNWIHKIKNSKQLVDNMKYILEIVVVILLFTITSKIDIYDNANRNVFIKKLLSISQKKIMEIVDSIHRIDTFDMNKQLLIDELQICYNKLILLDTTIVY